ncbi:MAG: NAD(P)-binding domain-containing protein [Candidatus Falkowbacteria bacterium]|nr:NAD(P)-binding domain-containing protein [Candidatus Falkowbacteria bacterium]
MPVVFVYGLGAFGYAILKHLDRHKRSSYVIAGYDRDKKVMDSLRKKRSHPRHQLDQSISKQVLLPESPSDIFDKADILILAVTANAIPEIVRILSKTKRSRKKLIVINAAKALDAKTGSRLELIIKKHLKHTHSYVYFAGGTIADDLYNSHPLGATIASYNKPALKVTEDLLASPNLRLYKTSDVSGAEYCGAFKNIVSIFAGLVSGLGWPYGSETFFISRFSREVERFVVKELRGHLDTFSMDSQCWGNDLWMSCTGKTRNREFGYLVGKGMTVNQAKADMAKRNRTVEGLTSISILKKLCKDFSSYPFLLAMQEIVLKNKKPKKIIESLIESRTI